MKVTLLHATPMTAIYRAVAICRNSKEPAKALHKALKAGHDSLLEQWSAGFKIEGVSRVLTHQLVRHRLASYAQESQRHVKIKIESLEWYVTPASAVPLFHTAIQVVGASYLECIKQGMPMEDARYLLPAGCVSKIVLTMNARSLHNFFHERLCSRAQWEIHDLAEKMFNLCYNESPRLFKGPFPDCDRCKEPCR